MTKEDIARKYIPCRCDKIYTSRGLTAPDCPYHSTDPESAMDEYAKTISISFAEWKWNNVQGDAGSENDKRFLLYSGQSITAEELYDKFLVEHLSTNKQ